MVLKAEMTEFSRLPRIRGQMTGLTGTGTLKTFAVFVLALTTSNPYCLDNLKSLPRSQRPILLALTTSSHFFVDNVSTFFR